MKEVKKEISVNGGNLDVSKWLKQKAVALKATRDAAAKTWAEDFFKVEINSYIKVQPGVGPKKAIAKVVGFNENTRLHKIMWINGDTKYINIGTPGKYWPVNEWEKWFRRPEIYWPDNIKCMSKPEKEFEEAKEEDIKEYDSTENRSMRRVKEYNSVEN